MKIWRCVCVCGVVSRSAAAPWGAARICSAAAPSLGGWGGRSRAHLHTKMYLLLSVDVVPQSMGMLALLRGLAAWLFN